VLVKYGRVGCAEVFNLEVLDSLGNL